MVNLYLSHNYGGVFHPERICVTIPGEVADGTCSSNALVIGISRFSLAASQVCLYCFCVCSAASFFFFYKDVIGNRGFLCISFGNLAGEMYEGRAVADCRALLC